MTERDSGAPAAQRSALSSDDHPGGPLSRAERVLLSHLKNRFFEARQAIANAAQLMGAIPGAQKIEERRKEALTSIDRLLESIKTRKQGAPGLGDEPEASAAQPPPEASKP